MNTSTYEPTIDARILNGLGTSATRPVRWIVVGRLLDPVKRQILTSVHLVYSANRIEHIGVEHPQPDLVPGLDKPDAILTDFTALPCLIDAHTHIFLEGGELDPDKRNTNQKLPPDQLLHHAEQRLTRIAQLGITAMRDGGDKDAVGLTLASGETTKMGLPSLFSPGPGIHRKGRYGAFFGRAVEDEGDLITCVNNRITAKASHIKIVPTGIINFAKGMVVTQPQFSAEEIAQMTAHAHAAGRQVMAHASGTAGIDVVIQGHVDSIEHGFFVTNDQLHQIRDQGIAWVPTLVPVQVQVDHAEQIGWIGETLDNLKRIVANHIESIQKAQTLGVRIRIGSDGGSHGVTHGIGLLREMELLEMAGLNTLDLLCCATFDNSDLLPLPLSPAPLRVGGPARFMLTQNDPFETVTNLKVDRWTIFDGTMTHSDDVSLAGL